MPTTNHTVTVTIDGTDRSASLLYDALNVSAGIGNTGNVADIELTETAGYEPQAWDEVIITVDGTRIFGGFVATRMASGLATGDNRLVRWSLACRDWSMLLDRLVIDNAQFFDMSDANIVRALFEDYLQPEGFDLSRVQFTRAGLEIGFQRMTVRQALDRLASQVGAGWYIDPNKRLYWYNRWAPPRAAFDINTDSPDNSTSYDVLAGSMQRTIDDSRAINRVEVYGKDVQGQERTQAFLTPTDGSYGYVSLDYRVHSVASVTAEFAAGTMTLSGSSIGYEPECVLYGTGSDPSRMRYVVVNREQQTVKFLSTTGGPPLGGTLASVRYYELTTVHVVVEDADLQALHGRVLAHQVFNESIADATQATNYANYLLGVYGRGAETVSFDVAEWGLLPGTEIEVYSPTLKLGPTISQASLKVQAGGYLLLEDGSELLLQAQGEAQVVYITLQNDDDLLLEDGSRLRQEMVSERFLIVQEVSYRPVHTPTGWMMVASVTAGERELTLIDLVAGLTGGAGVAGLPAAQLYGRVSDIASDLGEVVAGRALFTDGGTAPFEWGTPNLHSGVVVGLDDSGSDPRGAVEIYDVGTRRLKLGYLDGLPAVGTVNPSGWGIWTNNGFFQGQVAASVITGGTITGVQVTGNYVTGGTVSGALVSGGTVSGALVSGNTVTGGTVTGAYVSGGTVSGALVSGIQMYAAEMIGGTVKAGVITGGTITGAQVAGGTVSGALVSGGAVEGNLIYGGTIRTSVNPVNSSNPGVMMSPDGLLGYGTAGVTFKIPTDPADRPMFSSGTILNTVYELYTASVIRTGTANPRVQMDSSGVFGYGPTGTVKFGLDSTTGRMTASDGIFSGSISASVMVGGSISGAIVTAGTITGARVTAGTITGVSITGNSISGGTVTGSRITGGTITGVAISANNISGGTVTGALMSAGTVSGGTVSGVLVSGGVIQGAWIEAGTISSMYIGATRVVGGTVSGALVSGNTVQAGTVTGALISGNSISGGTITGVAISGNTVSGGTVTGSRVSGGTVTGALVSGGTVSGTYVSGGTAKFSSTYGTAQMDGRGLVMYASNVTGQPFGVAIYNAGETHQAGAQVVPMATGRQLLIQTSGTADLITLQVAGGWPVVIDQNGIANYDLRPNDTFAGRNLGDSTHAWKYVYLQNSDGNVKRLEINNGTVLIT